MNGFLKAMQVIRHLKVLLMFIIKAYIKLDTHKDSNRFKYKYTIKNNIK